MNIIRSCVYFLFDGDELVYIGKSTNLHARIGQHIAEGQKKFDRFEVFETDDQDRLEEFMIRLLQPKYNGTVPNNFFTEMGFKKRSLTKMVEHYHDGIMELIPYEETMAYKLEGKRE